MAFGRKKDGMSIIDENVGKFQNIIDGLDQGICLCEDEVSSNEDTIRTLTNKNETIDKSKKQAVAFKGKLSDMLSIPNEEENKED